MSNETLKVSPEKTKLAHSLRLIVILFVVLLILVATIAIAKPAHDTQTPYVVLNGTQFAVELADSDEERIRGLSGKPSLADGSGMLFEFTEPAQQCIWMKDMQFSIDIVWMDSAGRVLDAKEHVSPDTYPDQFCSSDPTMYMLELPAGTLADHDVAVGDTIEINL